ncbi:hypothetical protein EC957_003941 [Mortierella hygrophila]|uniref:Uncharacterized protein n=1 Tax=Mortierella hygrophila TaxID=979708 RepID=A0A9P6K0M2_9FUNG|nr:hypothetical protein EC957_003941 [Mortierella hygrophila]
MNLGALFLKSTASRSDASALAPKSQRHDAETPEMNLGFLFPDIDPTSNQQHSRDHLGPDYDIKGLQLHNDQKQSEQNKADGIQVYIPKPGPYTAYPPATQALICAKLAPYQSTAP